MKQPTQIVAKVDYVGRGAVVTVPQSIEPWHTRCLREQLLWLLDQRISEIVIDFTFTVSCAAGMREAMERVHTRAEARGIELSLVLGAGSPAARILNGSGLTRLLYTHSDRTEAERGLLERFAERKRGSASGAVPSQRGDGRTSCT
ncbi:hypothetical protein [Streptomonospora salina]|uniref:STAS domain-containing protein n=1 Tax=Streptomonospora salina TaxID=104205 RepID=A0A841EGX5_9ACTN|nr:hypothetical protein [Streptomonospora salina]MBB5998671.1 hypothetical protein [Streptomonospora salina]